MAAGSNVSFDLVLATLGRTTELHEMLESLERPTHQSLRVLLVDQNGDERLREVVAAHPAVNVVRIRSAPGLSRARNSALPYVTADVVAFPDDDCRYPDDLLERVARRFAAEGDLGALTGRTGEPDGTASARWPRDSGPVTNDNLWHRCNSASMFMRGSLLTSVGGFDERLGLGAGTPWSSGEEIDLMSRALALGARVEYDPTLVVWHPVRRLSATARRAVGLRDGGSVGYVLSRNRYPARIVARMLVRPVGGIAASLARFDLDGVRFHAATLRGRVAGYRAGRAARSSANSSA